MKILESMLGHKAPSLRAEYLIIAKSYLDLYRLEGQNVKPKHIGSTSKDFNRTRYIFQNSKESQDATMLLPSTKGLPRPVVICSSHTQHINQSNIIKRTRISSSSEYYKKLNTNQNNQNIPSEHAISKQNF